MVRYQEKYKKEIVPKLQEEFKYGNVNEVPGLEKIVINMGVGEAVLNSKALDMAVDDMTKIAGQKPILRRARKSIANFKLREGMPIGCSVTLRRDRMYEFLDRLVNVALPRVRDFRGIPKNAFDGRGNYSLGVSEQIIFPEIDLDKTKLRGMSINFVTSAKSDAEGFSLLKNFGMPFRN